jgi:hypothetical protein
MRFVALDMKTVFKAMVIVWGGFFLFLGEVFLDEYTAKWSRVE